MRNGKFLDQLSNSQLLIRLTCRLCSAGMSINGTIPTLIIIRKSATWYNAISSQHSTAMSLRKQPTGSLGSDRYVEMSGGPHETDETLMRASNK